MSEIKKKIEKLKKGCNEFENEGSFICGDTHLEKIMLCRVCLGSIQAYEEAQKLFINMLQDFCNELEREIWKTKSEDVCGSCEWFVIKIIREFKEKQFVESEIKNKDLIRYEEVLKLERFSKWIKNRGWDVVFKHDGTFTIKNMREEKNE